MFAVARPGGTVRQTALFALAGISLGVLSGAAAAYNSNLGIVVAVVLTGGVVALARPALVAVAALIGVYATYRLGGAGDAGGVSYSDALLAAATILAVPSVFGSVEFRRLHVPLVGMGIYLATLLPTIFLNPSHRAYLEWFHRLFLVAGAMIVGAWIVRAGMTRVALRLLIAVSGVIGVAAVVDGAATGFDPASPFGLNKNLVGALFGLVVIMLVAADPGLLGLSRRWRSIALAVVVLGLIASQSRGGMLAAAAGLLLAFALDWRGHGRNAKVVGSLAALGFVAFVAVSVHGELSQTKLDRNNNSLGVRFNVERATRNIWRTSPIDGVGLKYFVNGYFGIQAQAPNNVIDNELAESGIIGLTGFVLFEGVVIMAGVYRRRDGPLVIVGTCCVVGELVHGLVDIYWSAGPPTLAFMVFGLGLTLREPTPSHAAPGKITSSTRASTAVHS